MRTSNERNNIGIIGIILLIANWVFVFGINSYMYDHRNENSGLLPFVWEMVAVIIGFTALSAYSHIKLKNKDKKEDMYSILFMLLCFFLCVVSICFVNNRVIRLFIELLGVDGNVDHAVFYASSLLFLGSGIGGMICRRSYPTVKSSLAICISLLGIYLLLHCR